MSRFSHIALQAGASLLLTALLGAALFNIADYATKGVIT